ncbi:uncharacterized protein EI90DRAFT_2879041, partial [Cantharellus anzutake]|uniref:uncharacterized protein n=1 Tax=Cantharellus anzutake TaxID=1750568 RepID=UPI00190464D3
LRVMVQEHLFPVTMLTLPHLVCSVYYSVIKCHEWLCEIAHVLHRDVSLNNVMWRAKNNEVYGVLNDYDLAIMMDDHSREASSNQRTGTRPYLARDFLCDLPPRHLPRHDIESFVYVMVAHLSRYEQGKVIQPEPLEDW